MPLLHSSFKTDKDTIDMDHTIVVNGEQLVFYCVVEGLGNHERVVLCKGVHGEVRAIVESKWNVLVSMADSTVCHVSSKQEKIRFFLSMFKSREDVFALRFHSKKTGKDGYSVACRNNGVYGV